ncbi:MAG: helix-turn-helix domain-containing protein [Pseudonocardiaceae bacterium]
MDEDAQAIGARLREIREARGKSLAVIAGLAGITEAYLSMLETGKRALNRRSLIVALANALEVSPSDLFDLGTSPLPAEPATEAAIGAVRDAMQAVDVGEPGGQVQPVEQLAVRAETALSTAQAMRLAEAGAMLPDLIRDLHTSIDAGHDVADLLRWCAVLYPQAVESWLFGVSAPVDLCWLAARAGRDAARRLDEPVALGVAAFGLSNYLLTRGSFDLAGRALPPRDTGDDQLDGMLSLTRCLVATSDSRPGDVEAPLEMAAELAARTGDGNAHWMSFGPSNVALWRVSVALESGDHERAAQLSDEVHPTALPPRRRVNHYTNRARALSQIRPRREDAVLALRSAEKISPDSVRRSPGARRLLGELVTRTRDEALGRELRGMAYRAGLAV